jgi:surfeit locus 1 family protein
MILFIRLGVWQLDRGNFKSLVQESVVANSASTVQQPSLPLNDLESWRYRNITLTGNFMPDRQFLLDNQIRDQQPGYSVLSAFHVPGMNTTILVDRGWLPQAARREQLPDISVSSETLTIKGSIYVPYENAYSLGEIAEGEDSGWPRRIQFVDYEQLSARLATQLQPFTLRLNAAMDNGYRRDWVESQSPANKHYGYAFQWFAMAAAVVVLWWINIVVANKKNERNKEK